MCLAVPAEVMSIDNQIADCQIGEKTRIQASLMLLDEEVSPGDYVLIHAGFALRKLDLQEAQESLRLMQEIVGNDGAKIEW